MALFADIVVTTDHMLWGGLLLAPLLTVITYLFTNMWADKKAQLAKAEQDKAEAIAKHEALAEAERKELKEKMKSFEEIGRDATAMLLALANKKQAEAGLPPIKIKPDVVAESHSPVTEEQQKTADLATQRATLTAVTEALGFPAREAGPPETSDQRKDRRDLEKVGAAIDHADKTIKDTVRADIADLKTDVAVVQETTDKIAEKIAEKVDKQSPPGGAS